MVVGFDASRAFVGERTGTENYSYQLLKALAKIDKSNRYLVYTRYTFPSTAVEHNVYWPGNFRFIPINWPRLWTQGGLGLQTFKNKLDVLFVPAHTLPLIKGSGLKTVVTVHDLGSEYLPQMHQLKQRIYLSFMQKFQLKSATKIIAVSKATKGDLVTKVGIESKKVEVVYEGFDKKLFKPVKGDTLVNILNHYDLRTNNYLLFVGTVQPRKNLTRLIEAFSRVIPYLIRDPYNIDSRFRGNDKMKLVIAGSKGWLSDEIYQLPGKLGIQERVKFLGYVAEKDLPALYSGAIALLFPSLFEGFGLPILEAQACGCPVITSNISSMPEVAGKGVILVNPYYIDDMAQAIIKITTNSKLQTKLTKLGFENIKRFSWEKCAEETLAVLEDTISI